MFKGSHLFKITRARDRRRVGYEQIASILFSPSERKKRQVCIAYMKLLTGNRTTTFIDIRSYKTTMMMGAKQAAKETVGIRNHKITWKNLEMPYHANLQEQ